jgi:hypothetical protein
MAANGLSIFPPHSSPNGSFYVGGASKFHLNGYCLKRRRRMQAPPKRLLPQTATAQAIASLTQRSCSIAPRPRLYINAIPLLSDVKISSSKMSEPTILLWCILDNGGKRLKNYILHLVKNFFMKPLKSRVGGNAPLPRHLHSSASDPRCWSWSDGGRSPRSTCSDVVRMKERRTWEGGLSHFYFFISSFVFLNKIILRIICLNYKPFLFLRSRVKTFKIRSYVDRFRETFLVYFKTYFRIIAYIVLFLETRHKRKRSHTRAYYTLNSA